MSLPTPLHLAEAMLKGQESCFWVILFAALLPSPPAFLPFGAKQQKHPIDLGRFLQAYAS